MAGEEDYESDPEEVKRSLAMRRREASDDEEEEEEEDEDDGGRRLEVKAGKVDPRAVSVSDGESEGAAPEYDDEEMGIEDDEGEEEDEEELEDYLEEEEEDIEVVGVVVERGLQRDSGDVAIKNNEAKVERKEPAGDGVVEDGHGGTRIEEEKKENEPFAVPTAGAFYMHDDRFRDSAGGRNRRTTPGGRKLWESKDERKWGHDKFEEITLQEKNYDEGRRRSKGHFRGRGKSRGTDRGNVRGNRSRMENANNNQSQAPRIMRGRGPQRYQPASKNKNEIPPTQNKQSGKPQEKPLPSGSGRGAPTSSAESTAVPAGKHVVLSSLNSASPPFYPSGSSNKEFSMASKKDVQAGNGNRNLRPPAADENNFSKPQSNTFIRGKSIVDSMGMDKLHIDGSTSPAPAKLSTGRHPLQGGYGNGAENKARTQGRGSAFSEMAFQSNQLHNQANRLSSSAHLPAVHRGSSVQSRVQPSSQSLSHTTQRMGNGSQASSPPKAAPSIKSYDSGEMELQESSKSNTALVGKGKSTIPGSGMGPFMYNGAQMIGAAGSMAGGHGDQNFPTFLPVMQFGNQHPGGIGVPAVGMAFPGYVAQPQLGRGSSEMTWLPVLAGAAGALGAQYYPPYIAMDGAYTARPSISASSASTSREIGTNKTNNEWKPSSRPEPVGDEVGQRQNKPRRYSEMNFGQ